MNGILEDLQIIPIGILKNKIIEHDFKVKLVNIINNLIEIYNIDSIFIEENKLFIDKIDKYPDPYILRNILLQYSIQITLEDNYLTNLKYFFVIPQKEWVSTILNYYSRYTIDFYKEHILEKIYLYENYKDIIEANNFYKTLCFAECCSYSKFMNKKYLVNYKQETRKNNE